MAIYYLSPSPDYQDSDSTEEGPWWTDPERSGGRRWVFEVDDERKVAYYLHEDGERLPAFYPVAGESVLQRWDICPFAYDRKED